MSPIAQLRSSLRSHRVAVSAAAAVGLGGVVAGCGTSTESAASTSAASTAAPTGATAGSAPTGGGPGAGGGGRGGPGMGTEATGTAATKAKAAALAEHPGTADRVMQLTDGSYVVGVTTDDGLTLVTVSAEFTVTGTQAAPQGGPGGGTPPTDTPPSSTTSAS